MPSLVLLAAEKQYKLLGYQTEVALKKAVALKSLYFYGTYLYFPDGLLTITKYLAFFVFASPVTDG